MQNNENQEEKIENNIVKYQKVDKGTNVEEDDQPYLSNYIMSNNRYVNNNENKNIISLRISVNDLHSFFGKTLVNSRNSNLLKNSLKIEKMKNVIKKTNFNCTRVKSNNDIKQNCNSLILCNNKLKEKLKQNKYVTIKTSSKFLLKKLNEPNFDNNISTSKNLSKNFYKEEYPSNKNKIKPKIKSEEKLYNYQKKIKDNKNIIRNGNSQINRNLLFNEKHYKIQTCYIEQKLPLLQANSYDELENNLSSTISSFNLNNILGIKKYKIQKKTKLNLKLKKNNIKKYKSSTKEKFGRHFLTNFLNELYEKKKKRNIIPKNTIMK